MNGQLKRIHYPFAADLLIPGLQSMAIHSFTSGNKIDKSTLDNFQSFKFEVFVNLILEIILH
jgi:hypothetical protein